MNESSRRVEHGFAYLTTSWMRGGLKLTEIWNFIVVGGTCISTTNSQTANWCMVENKKRSRINLFQLIRLFFAWIITPSCINFNSLLYSQKSTITECHHHSHILMVSNLIKSLKFQWINIEGKLKLNQIYMWWAKIYRISSVLFLFTELREIFERFFDVFV